MADHKRPEILAYYFPNWHVDPRNEIWHGKGWTEWNVAKYATPRFPGHHQPKIPLWGYEDEADPAVMAKKIDAAADHGIDGFIFDWYYYDDAPYRQRCLEEGFMRAANLGRTKFAVMWCNHDAIQAHPGCVAGPRPVLASGAVTPVIFTVLDVRPSLLTGSMKLFISPSSDYWSMTKLKVRDLMTTEVLTLRPDDTIKKAATKLALDNVSGAPIVDNKNHLLGFVSENDILNVIMKYQARLDKQDIEGSLLEYSMDSTITPDDNLKKVADEISNIEMSTLMVRSVMTTTPDAPIIEVLKKMLTLGINRIPVLEQGILVGIISRGDIIFALYKRKV